MTATETRRRPLFRDMDAMRHDPHGVCLTEYRAWLRERFIDATTACTQYLKFKGASSPEYAAACAVRQTIADVAARLTDIENEHLGLIPESDD